MIRRQLQQPQAFSRHARILLRRAGAKQQLLSSQLSRGHFHVLEASDPRHIEIHVAVAFGEIDRFHVRRPSPGAILADVGNDEVHLWISRRGHMIKRSQLLPLSGSRIIHHRNVQIEGRIEEFSRGMSIGPHASQSHRFHFFQQHRTQTPSLPLRAMRGEAD